MVEKIFKLTSLTPFPYNVTSESVEFEQIVQENNMARLKASGLYSNMAQNYSPNKTTARNQMKPHQIHRRPVKYPHQSIQSKTLPRLCYQTKACFRNQH